jgi:glucose/arabinose dehydrogenase
MWWKQSHMRSVFVIITMLLLTPLLFGAAFAQDDEGLPSSIGLQLVAEGLTSPVALAQPDDGSGRLFIADQVGVIYSLNADGQLQTFLDIVDRMVEPRDGFDERGLLGLALHPDFANNGRFFVYYSAPLQEGGPAEWDHTSHISEFTVSPDDGNTADPNSERIILRVDQPQFNHNAGDITFGPDGYLYIPLGDGGGGDDTGLGHTEGIGNAQDTSNLLGSILRIDIDNGDPYVIP